MSGPVTPPLEVTEVDGSPDGRPITKIVVSNGDLTVSGRTATIDTSGSGGAPASAEYLLAFDATIPATLTGARKLTVGSNISFVAGAGANDDMEIFARASREGSTINGQIQYQGLSNAFFAIEEFYYDVTTGGLRVGTNVTDGPATVTIAADGTGKPVLNLTNASESASLEVTTNQELTIKGGTDSFVFDVSSATGGITFPDATTQITAATSGGAGITLPNIGSTNETMYLISQGPIWGTTDISASVSLTSGDLGKCMAYPFIAPKTGNLSELIVYVNTADAVVDTCYLAIYSQGSDNLPETLLGYGSMSMASTGASSQASLSATVSLTAGRQYWFSINMSATGTAAVLRGSDHIDVPNVGIGSSINETGITIYENNMTAFAVPPATFQPSLVYSGFNRPMVAVKYA